MSAMSTSPCCSIVPPYLLEAIAARADQRAARCAERTLQRDAEHRGRRARGHAAAAQAEPGQPRPAARPQRVVSDAQGRETLPGTQVRSEGEPAIGDAAADEAYDGLGLTWTMFFEAFGRDSLDGRGLPLLATVHYGRDYDNAFWDGTQMVFGDGDGEIFHRFTLSVDVIGHELGHGVTERTAGLTYQGQSGALNESVSDVFGSLVRQHAAQQNVDEADWLIGAELFTDQVRGEALRSLKAPGTAYDDPRLGRDPQPAHMRDYVETTDDNGGVHINSGIPNHAFYLAATEIGGRAWEAAGLVWYDTLTSGRVPTDCDFETFAGLTVAAAENRYAAGSREAQAVRDAWAQVGVAAAGAGGGAAEEDGAVEPSAEQPPASVPATRLRVRRTGGLAGLQQRRTVSLSDLPDRDAQDWAALLDGGELRAIAERGGMHPDSFVYHVACPPEAEEITLPEHGIPQPVRDLFQRTLAGGP